MWQHYSPMALLAAALLFFLSANPAFCAIFQPGFRTLGAWSPDTKMRMDLNLWYPCARNAHALSYSPWTINAAPNAKPAEGRFPLLVLSHATPANRFSYHDLAGALASRGFVVAAPTHGHDCLANMDDLFSWNQLERRTREISAAIDFALSEKDVSQIIDRQAIGLLGFGAGGAAALLAGGALPSCASWPEYLRAAEADDPYARGWAREKIDTICKNFPLKESLADPRIKAVAAIAPGYGMFFDAASFASFPPRLLLAAAGRESFNRAEMHCVPLARILGEKAIYLDLPGADEGSLMAKCPQSLEKTLPELCLSVNDEERGLIHKALLEALIAFFTRSLHPAPQPLRQRAP